MEVDEVTNEVGPGDAILDSRRRVARAACWARWGAAAVLLRPALRTRRHVLRVGPPAFGGSERSLPGEPSRSRNRSGLGDRASPAARALAREGTAVVLTELPDRLERAATVAAEIVGDGGDAVALALDVREGDSIDRCVAEAVAWRGRIDVLVNNAGVAIRKPALALTPDDWDAVLDVNLRGVFFVAQAVGRAMRDQVPQGGAIVNVASIMGLVGSTERAAYGASKGGVVNLTRMLAVEWAPLSIRVNAVCPTFVDTPLTRPMFAERPAFHAEVLEKTPLGEARDAGGGSGSGRLPCRAGRGDGDGPRPHGRRRLDGCLVGLDLAAGPASGPTWSRGARDGVDELRGAATRIPVCSYFSRLPVETRHAADLALLVGKHERDARARASGAAGATDAVRVRLVVLGRVEVDHVRDVVQVEPAGGDVRGDQRRDLAGLEAVRAPARAAPGPCRRAWRPRRRRRYASRLREPVGATLRAHEHEREPALGSSSSSTSFSTLLSAVTETNRCVDLAGRRSSGSSASIAHGSVRVERAPARRPHRRAWRRRTSSGARSARGGRCGRPGA